MLRPGRSTRPAIGEFCSVVWCDGGSASAAGEPFPMLRDALERPDELHLLVLRQG